MQMPNAPQYEWAEDENSYSNWRVRDPLGLDPFSKEIEQTQHAEVSYEDVREEMARERDFEHGEF